MPPLFFLLGFLCLIFPREAATVWLLLFVWIKWLRLR